MRYVLAKDPTVTARFARFARNVWGLQGEDDAVLALQGIEALEAFIATLDLPSTLTEVGIDETHFEEMAVHADLGGRLSRSYSPLMKEDAVAILKNCL